MSQSTELFLSFCMVMNAEQVQCCWQYQALLYSKIYSFNCGDFLFTVARLHSDLQG